MINQEAFTPTVEGESGDVAFTEAQWAALGAWIVREARDHGNGMLSRCGHITSQEQDARAVFGLPPIPPGYHQQLEARRQTMLSGPVSGVALGSLNALREHGKEMG